MYQVLLKVGLHYMCVQLTFEPTTYQLCKLFRGHETQSQEIPLVRF